MRSMNISVSLQTQHVLLVHIRDRTACVQFALLWCLLDTILAYRMEMRSLRLQQQREQEEADRMRYRSFAASRTCTLRRQRGPSLLLVKLQSLPCS